MSTFEKYKLQEFCYQTINELGFIKPTPIQEQVIPLGYKNNDIKKVVASIDSNLTIENQIKEALKLLLK